MIKLKSLLTELNLPDRAELDKLGWDEERSGWFDHEGYHITTSRDDRSFIALTPDGKVIARGLRNFGLADNKVDQYKQRLGEAKKKERDPRLADRPGDHKGWNR